MRRILRLTLPILAVAAAAPAAHAAAAAPSYAELRVPVGTAHVLAPVRAPFRFDLAGARWHARGAVAVELRVRTAATRRWSGWQPVEASDPSPEQHDRSLAHGEPVWAKGSDAVQLRWRGAGRLRDLRAAFVAAGRSPALVPVRSLARFGAQPPIVTRAEWGADERIRRGTTSRAASLKAIFIHHTATANGYTAAQAPAVVRSIYTYHVRSNGWNDIGYNYLVDAYGRIYEGRAGGVAQNVIGAHTLGFNTSTAGVAVIGNGSTKGLTDVERDALVELLSWRLDLAHVDPLGTARLTSSGNPKYASGRVVSLRVISGHRDGYPTECPGNLVYAALPSIAQEVAATGLPKIYTPAISPSPPATKADGTVGSVAFAARAAGAATWTVKVLARDGTTLAQGTGRGATITWTWNGRRTNGEPVAVGVAAGWRIEATAANGVAARPATGGWGTNPPPVPPTDPGEISVTPRSFSPNGDGTEDVAKIRYTTDRAAIVQVSILDASGLVIATPAPSASLPAGEHAATWNGLGLDGLTPVAEGAYRVLVSSVDATGLAETAVGNVALTRTVAALRLGRSVASPNGDARFDRVPITWRQDVAGQVSVTLTRGGAVVATLLDGIQPAGPATLSWDGAGATGVLRNGSYLVVLRAQTAAGEQVMARRLTVDLAPPVIRRATARAWSGGGALSLRLSEPALIKVAAGSRVLVPFSQRKPGVNGFRWSMAGMRGRNLTVYAWDLAGNRMRPLTVRPVRLR